MRLRSNLSLMHFFCRYHLLKEQRLSRPTHPILRMSLNSFHTNLLEEDVFGIDVAGVQSPLDDAVLEAIEYGREHIVVRLRLKYYKSFFFHLFADQVAQAEYIIATTGSCRQNFEDVSLLKINQCVEPLVQFPLRPFRHFSWPFR